MSFVKPTITSWSFSRYNVYMACPKQAYFKFIRKIKEPGSAAMDRGTAYHKLCEEYLKGRRRIVPKELKAIAPDLKELKAKKALAEADFTFKQDWSATRWDDWTGAWCRIKADVIVPPVVDDEVPTVEVSDFKTGKFKEGYSEYSVQLELYGLAGLLAYPTAQKATSKLIFIDHGITVPSEDEFTQKDVAKLKKKWEIMVRPMLNDTQFKPKPGSACRFCNFSKAKGGECVF